MAFVAVDKDGSENLFDQVKPYRDRSLGCWFPYYDKDGETHPWIELPKGSIRKLIGRELTWLDEPVELKGE